MKCRQNKRYRYDNLGSDSEPEADAPGRDEEGVDNEGVRDGDMWGSEPPLDLEQIESDARGPDGHSNNPPEDSDDEGGSAGPDDEDAGGGNDDHSGSTAYTSLGQSEHL